MLITACTIGTTDLIGSLTVKPTRLRFGALGEVSTATLEFIGVASTLGPILLAGEDVEIETAGGTIFLGTIATVDTRAVIVKASGTGPTRFTVQCQGRESQLLDTVITADAVYSVESDADIIADVFGTYLAGVDLTNVDIVGTVSMTVRAGWTIRQFMDELIARTQAIYYMDGNALWFHGDTATSAPFDLKESQDAGVGEIAPLWQNFSHQSSWANRANRVTVLGVATTGGTRVTATVNDTGSQATYGVISRTITDTNILSTGEATARGNVELANYANPQVSGRFQTRTDGFAPGQSITITMPSERISEACFIRAVEWAWETPEDVTYTCEYGQFSANLIRRLQQIQQDSKEKPQVAIAIPAPAVIAPSHFSSTIEPVHLVSSLPTLPDSNYPNNSVVVLTTTGKLYRNLAGSWSAAVATTDLTGTITNTQIADDSISTPKLQANSITAAKIGAGEVTAGKLAADSVIAGTIAAGAIRAVDAAFDTAAIQTADIANLAVTDAKINTLSASKITAGTIDANSITVTNLNATNITTGTLNGSRIGAGSITGGAGGHLASATITDANIVNATITSAKIASLDVSKLNAGTVNVGSGGITIAGTNCTISLGSTGLIMSGTAPGIQAGNILAGGSLTFGTSLIGPSGNTVVDSSRNITGVDLNITGVYKMDGTEIINTSGAFVGAGVACTANGIGGTGVAVYQSGWYYGVVGPSTFTTNDGKTATVRGGIITDLV
jgi:hypothetical protein